VPVDSDTEKRRDWEGIGKENEGVQRRKESVFCSWKRLM